MLRNILKTTGAVALLAASAFSIPNELTMNHITSASFTPGATKVLSADSVYFLEGAVTIPAGATLHINPGTWIYGSFSMENIAFTSMLIVSPNAILEAEGTVDSPIVFTTLRDEKNDACDFGPGAKGLWGGIIWCGEAPTASPTLGYPEGIPDNLAGVYYGGTRAHYYGGKMKYVSIRHGGCALASNSETNGLSLYAIGDSTQISYVEVFANSDDGVEFFGGNVNTRYMTSTFNNDDAFDLDEGYSGKNQFWFALQQEYEGDRDGEFDGKVDAGQLFVSDPTIYNFTFIGAGAGVANNGIMLRDSVRGTYCNGIVTEFGAYGVRRAKQSDGYNVIAKPYGNSGDSIRFQGNMFWKCGDNTWTGTVNPSTDHAYVQANGNVIADPMLRGINRKKCGHPRLDPRPKMGSPALNGYVALPSNSSFWTWTTANYRGAFSPTNLWLTGWTASAHMGILAKLVTISPATCYHQGRRQERMRISFFVNQPGATIKTTDAAFDMTVDGVNVEAAFLNPANIRSYALTAGGVCYYVEYSAASTFIPPSSPVPVIGTHTIDITFPLSTGEVIKDAMTWTIVQ